MTFNLFRQSDICDMLCFVDLNRLKYMYMYIHVCYIALFVNHPTTSSHCSPKKSKDIKKCGKTK